MAKRLSFIVLPVCALIALSAAFLFVSPAFAQDELPPEVAPTEVPVEVLPTESAPVEVVHTEAPVEVLPAQAAPVELLPTEVAPAEVMPTEAAPADNAPVEEAPTAEPSLAEQLDDAGVAIADSTGTTLSLATNSTQDLVTGGDPYYIVGSVRYSFLRLGGSATCPPDTATSKCVSSLTPIQDALNSMVTYGTPTDRKLYIQADIYTENVFVNGLLAGVKGLTAIQGVDALGKPADPSTVVINGRLEIQNFPLGFSVNNLTVINSTDTASVAIWAKKNGGTIKLTDVTAQATQQDSSGIIIDGSGAELTRVTSNDNAYHGLYIHTTNGIPVKITDSTFDHNLLNVIDGIPDYDTVWGCGDPAFPNCTKPIAQPFFVSLEIHRYVGGREAVTLNGVSASNNKGIGASIHIYTNSVTVKNSVFNDNIPITDRSGNGLHIDGQNVILMNVEASGNSENGVDNYGWAGTTFNATGLTVDGNGGDGLFIQTGHWVETPKGSGNWEITPIGAGPITLKGINASGNGEYGLSVTTDGTFSLLDAFLSENDFTGVYVYNRYSKTTPAVTITNIKVINNSWDGIDLYTKGPVTIKNFQAYDNGINGIRIDSCIDFDYDEQVCNSWGNSAVTLTNDYGVFNASHDNLGDGIKIETGGAVTITNTDSYGNGVGGVIDNSVGTLASPVTINVNGPVNYYDSFSNNVSEGIVITSHGVVTISKIWAEGNGYSGVAIDNEPWYLNAGIPVAVLDSVFEGNSGRGLDLYSKGQITLTNIRANNNSWDGLYLDNKSSSGTAGITIIAGPGKGNEMKGNKGNGLYLLSNGPVILTNLYAANNNSGVYINNASAGKPAVTLKQVGVWKVDGNFIDGNVFNKNKYKGLEIHSNGAVTVGFFQATGNGGDGINIDASGGTGAVILNGTSNWNDNMHDNLGTGLKILAKGNIAVTGVDISFSGGPGGTLDNCRYDSGTKKCLGSGSVSLTNASFDNNHYGDGLNLISGGAITWKNGSATANGAHGAILDNSKALAKPITVTNVETNQNLKTGLKLLSLGGAVTVTDTEAHSNSTNYYTITDGEYWQDNLSFDNNVWYFDANKTDEVNIEVSSLRAHPALYVTGPNGFYSDVFTTNPDMTTALMTFTLPDDTAYNGTYELHIDSHYGECWDCWSYGLKFYKGSVEPTWGAPIVDDANGIYVDNRLIDPSPILPKTGTGGAVTITNAPTNSKWNSNNSGTNLVIYTDGAVTLANMDLNDSGAAGLYLNNTSAKVVPAVTLTNVNFYNDEGDMGAIGTPVTTAYIATKGAVTVKTGTVGGNTNYGYYVDNNSFGTALSPITFTDVTINGDFGRMLGLDTSGIVLRSRGVVNFTNVTAESFGGNGIDISTQGAVTFNNVSASNNWKNTKVVSEKVPGMGYGVYVDTDGAFTLNTITSAENWFQWNDLDGLHVEAGGKITLASVEAVENGWWANDRRSVNTNANGIALINTNLNGLAPIVLTNIIASDNSQSGLYIDTNGAVTVTTLMANTNFLNGVNIDQLGAPDSLKPILLNKVTANSNYGDGIYVNALGSITTNYIRTNYNEHSGMVLDNAYTNSTGTITMLNTLGQNMTLLNGQTCVSDVCTPNTGAAGVKLISNGAITVNQLESDFNYGQGLWVDNSSSIALIRPVVTLNSVITRNNYYNGSGIGEGNRENWGHGMVVRSSGVITINNSWSVSNQGDGLRITSNANVFINNSSFIWNNNAGIWTADSTSTPTLKLTGTTWFGNLRHFSPDPGLDVPTGDRNLWRGTGWVLMVS